MIVTQGTTVLGKVFNAGSFNFTALAGTDYFVNFVAQPQGVDMAGTYSIDIGPTPPAPTLSLQSSAPSVTTGGTVTLSWTGTNVTSCTASGGWTGTQTPSGQATSPVLTANTTFTLNCTGAGGTVSQSVTVNVTSSSSSTGGGGGGGGAIRLDVLVLLFGLMLLRFRRALVDLKP